MFEARPVPGSHKLIFTATAHHSITGGSLVLLDRTRGTEFDAAAHADLTPEVCFPETEGWPDYLLRQPVAACPRSSSWSPGATASCRRIA